MNLHEWITERVDEAEGIAKRATPGPWEGVVDRHQRGVVDAGVWADCIGYYVTEKISSGDRHEADAAFIGTNDPAAALRRCEADRRILARHRLPEPGHWMYPACHGCGVEGRMDDPTTDNINDCPELLDLAHAHGITEQELDGLDRPERIRVAPIPPFARPAVTPVFLTVADPLLPQAEAAVKALGAQILDRTAPDFASDTSVLHLAVPDAPAGAVWIDLVLTREQEPGEGQQQWISGITYYDTDRYEISHQDVHVAVPVAFDLALAELVATAITRPITADQVPEALRGPRWGQRH